MEPLPESDEERGDACHSLGSKLRRLNQVPESTDFLKRSLE